jgi:tetratricopeptide (TPR) repeat protein
MDDEISALLSRANLARVRGNLDEAQAICQAALELNPSAADAHSLLGDLFAAQDKHDEALHCYSLASELKPGSISLREKRDKAVQARHNRLLATQKTQQQAAVPKETRTVKEEKGSTTTKLASPARPRWLIAVLVGAGGVVMLLLGIWLGTTLAHKNDLVPTKTPATVGR